MKIYLATAYSHPDPKVREQRFLRANRIASHLIEKGYIVYSPISHSHPIAECMNNHNDKSVWLRQCIAFIEWADCMYIINCPENRQSEGVQMEINRFLEKNKKIFSINENYETLEVLFD
jgi:hypothetical protein